MKVRVCVFQVEKVFFVWVISSRCGRTVLEWEEDVNFFLFSLKFVHTSTFRGTRKNWTTKHRSNCQFPINWEFWFQSLFSRYIERKVVKRIAKYFSKNRPQKYRSLHPAQREPWALDALGFHFLLPAGWISVFTSAEFLSSHPCRRSNICRAPKFAYVFWTKNN